MVEIVLRLISWGGKQGADGEMCRENNRIKIELDPFPLSGNEASFCRLHVPVCTHSCCDVFVSGLCEDECLHMSVYISPCYTCPSAVLHSVHYKECGVTGPVTAQSRGNGVDQLSLSS